ncbi:hypothetical protein [Actinophytocola xanthii]|uniref:Uncharacterized protein n=1 Tax=Actinophytocola xanthii TaxID=1912961 RepID=A0A1Q8CNK1_9PSEU|nr:hypothetical protein [Actinophytocola xanthii]OLF15939.1 hypothetical protein BU204_18700 [Actinophytocola xanthii]
MQRRTDRILPLGLASAFTVVVQGLSLVEFLPVLLALLAAAAWAVVVDLAALWVRRHARLSAWVEDVLVALGVTAMALFAFGGAIGLMMLGLALDSSSISGETMVLMFLPSIPIAIAANLPTELVVIPGLLVLGWRRGPRRVLVVVAAGLYLVLRVWTYLVFAGDRLDLTEAERSTTPLTAAQREEFAAAFHVEDPRWILNLAVFVVLLLAAFFPRNPLHRRATSATVGP